MLTTSLHLATQALPQPLIIQRAIFGLGTTELVIILLIVMVLFGAGKLPALGSGIGKAIRNFKKEVKGEDSSNLPK